MSIKFGGVKVSGNITASVIPTSLPTIFGGTDVENSVPIYFSGSETTFFSNNIVTLPIGFPPSDITVFNSNDLLVAPIGFESPGYIVFNSDVVSTLPLTFL